MELSNRSMGIITVVRTLVDSAKSLAWTLSLGSSLPVVLLNGLEIICRGVFECVERVLILEY